MKLKFNALLHHNPIKTTFSNIAQAEEAGAINIVTGKCTRDLCETYQGKWIYSADECEDINEEICNSLGVVVIMIVLLPTETMLLEMFVLLNVCRCVSLDRIYYLVACSIFLANWGY